jgi:hypothetical protein
MLRRSGSFNSEWRNVMTPLVEEALKAITQRTNLSTGLVHPNDRAAAVQMFEKLNNANVMYDPEELYTWSLRNGWTSEGARELRDVAEGVKDGKRHRIDRNPFWKPDILEILKDRIEDEK